MYEGECPGECPILLSERSDDCSLWLCCRLLCAIILVNAVLTWKVSLLLWTPAQRSFSEVHVIYIHLYFANKRQYSSNRK